MCRHRKRMWRWTAIAVTIGLYCCSEANAKKPPKPRGGPAYTIVPFSPLGIESIRSTVTDLNEVGQAVGFAEIDGSQAGNLAVHYDISTGVYTVLQDGLLCRGRE